MLKVSTNFRGEIVNLANIDLATHLEMGLSSKCYSFTLSFRYVTEYFVMSNICCGTAFH